MGVQSISLSNHALFFLHSLLSLHPPSCVISPTNKNKRKNKKKYRQVRRTRLIVYAWTTSSFLHYFFPPLAWLHSFYFRTHENSSMNGAQENNSVSNSVLPICLKLFFLLEKMNSGNRFIFAYTRWLAGWDYFFGETPTLKVSFPGAP